MQSYFHGSQFEEYCAERERIDISKEGGGSKNFLIL
jgi:hypothetical protein